MHEENKSLRTADGQRRPEFGMRGLVKSIKGHASGRGIPEALEIVLQNDDGSVIEARMPRPNGIEVAARLIPLSIEFIDFGECPICLEPKPNSREHVPPHSIGGNVMTLTCERCNNEFGSRYEPHLQTWYEGSMGRVRISGGDVKGRRNAGEYLLRVTPDDEVVLLPFGRSDPAVEDIIRSGQFEVTYPNPDGKAAHLAAVKTAYLAACLIMREIPRTPHSDAIRAELLAARDRDRAESYELSSLLKSIQMSRSEAEPVLGEICLTSLSLQDGSISYAISFNRVFAVDWPLDPIRVEVCESLPNDTQATFD
ncbi:HNH endonuclease [Cryobacterium sp. RTS3]|uniref:HNH endonuclease n=1 Tax=Cryobacterium sp. RTS3 TaxID=3048643 RepID=UPI002B233BC9|nr:HNH endonuclease [Cryobacterium sp. RTS3]MEB0000412.1 HNH endonuclease [Cryobacterium sp. RTS3]